MIEVSSCLIFSLAHREDSASCLTASLRVQKMAAFNRPTNATYEVHESVTVDTTGKTNRKLASKGISCSSGLTCLLFCRFSPYSTGRQ